MIGNRRDFIGHGIAAALAATAAGRAGASESAGGAGVVRDDVLRHLVMATPDLQRTSLELRKFLALHPRPQDLFTAQKHGFYNEMHLIGSCLIELVSPLEPSHRLAKWLAQNGEGGYMLVLQTFDARALRQRALELSVVLTKDSEYNGHPVLQFDERKFGSFFETYQFSPPENWFGLPPRRAPYEPSELAEEIVALDVAVEAPAELAALTAKLFKTPSGAAGNGVSFGQRSVRFVPIEKRRGLVGLDVKSRDRARAGEAANICGMQIRLV